MRRYARGKMQVSSYEVHANKEVALAEGVVILLSDSMFEMDRKNNTKTRPCLIVNETIRGGEVYFTVVPLSTKWRDDSLPVTYNGVTSYAVESKAKTISEETLYSINKGIKGYAEY